MAVTIVQGEDRTINFQVKEVDSSGVTTYLDLSGTVYDIELKLAGTSGTVSFKKSTVIPSTTTNEIVIVDGKAGLFKVNMSDDKTELLKLGANQNAEVLIDLTAADPAGERRIVQLSKAITVVKQLFA